MRIECDGGSPTPEIILPPECLTLPPICQQGVKEVLDFLKKQERAIESKTLEEVNNLIPQIRESAQNVFDALRPFKTNKCSWEDAQKIAENGMKAKAKQINRTTSMNAAGGKAWRTLILKGLDPKDKRVDYGVSAAEWETIKDQLGFENNPFWHLLDLFRLGADYWIVFCQVDGKEMLVVDFPLEIPKIDEDRGCLAFGDGEGDNEVLYVHKWFKGCKSNMPLKKNIPKRHIK